MGRLPAEHVRATPLPLPGDEASLLRSVEQLRRHRLDRSRPLWEVWLLPGLSDGRVGLFIRMHHVIADGIAGVATISALLDSASDVGTASAPPWRPAPAPTARDLLTDNLRRKVSLVGHAFSRLTHPRTLPSPMRGIREFIPHDGGTTTSLNRMIGSERSLAVVRAGMDEVSQIAHAHGATVNDVLLAATAGGLRALLRAAGN